MTTDDFYAADPGSRASWRLAVLMGANSRTYKFALGHALLTHAARGDTSVALTDLAAAYAMALVEHAAQAPQAPAPAAIGENDFLAVTAGESEESRRLGRPTDRLLEAAVRSMPTMVMEKFHNLPGRTQVPHRFYDLAGSTRSRTVLLTPELIRLAQSEQAAGLHAELEARWNIVETSFTIGIGRSLIREGVAVDWTTLTLTDKRRRRPVTKVKDAMIGFQNGRCFLCDEVIGPFDDTAIDHVFPFSLMNRFAGTTGWHGPDLDALWNLAPVHASCNSTKGARLPFPTEISRLARRNEAIMPSQYPLSRTLRLSLTQGGNRPTTSWLDFLHEVEKLFS
ncbi:HNH endonuclease [Streptomyces lydicus]|uniref:HNH endonuclease n=1 Tax=Streptomyces lydicus TaxID=47763 RepID=UPI00369FBA5F